MSTFFNCTLEREIPQKGNYTYCFNQLDPTSGWNYELSIMDSDGNTDDYNYMELQQAENDIQLVIANSKATFELI